MRAVACLTVLSYHTGHSIKTTIGMSEFVSFLSWDGWGLAGVSLFFCISGFVISNAADRTSGPRQFLVDRAIRIYPGYFIAVLSTITLKLIAYGSFPWAAYKPSSLTLLPLGTIDYILGIEWSLTYEIAFYIAIAACLSIRSSNYLGKLSLLWIAVILYENLFGETKWSTTTLTPRLTGTLLSGYCIPFCAGIICHKSINKLKYIDWRYLPLAAASYGIYALSVNTTLTILSLTLSGCVLVTATVNSIDEPKNQGILSAFSWIGDRSYGIYLFHAPLISTLALTTIKSIMPSPSVAAASLLMIGFAGSVAYASLEHHIYRSLRSKLRHK